ncbi:hypothetical protein AAMO2058_000766700 [Amorphochlora amoebiformis]
MRVLRGCTLALWSISIFSLISFLSSKHPRKLSQAHILKQRLPNLLDSKLTPNTRSLWVQASLDGQKSSTTIPASQDKIRLQAKQDDAGGSGSASKNGKAVICYLCGEEGHMSWQCKDASTTHVVRTEKFRRRIEGELLWLLNHTPVRPSSPQTNASKGQRESRAMLGRLSDDEISLVYPRRLRGWERKIIHRECEKLGLASKSRGEGRLRRVTVFPNNVRPPVPTPCPVPLGPAVVVEALPEVDRDIIEGLRSRDPDALRKGLEHKLVKGDALLFAPGVTPAHLAALACSAVSQAPARGDRRLGHMRSKEYMVMRHAARNARISPGSRPAAQPGTTCKCPGVELMRAVEAAYSNGGDESRAKEIVVNGDAYGITPTSLSYIEGILPIHCAAFGGCLSCLKHVLQAGGDEAIEAEDAVGRTPLYWAIAGGATENVRYLLEKGAIFNKTTAVGRTMLTKASWCNLPEVVIMLLKSGADFDHRDQKGRTAMHVSVASGSRASMLAIFDELGPSVPMRKQDGFGSTPFHIAAGGTDPSFRGVMDFLIDQIDRRQRRGALLRELAEIRNLKGDTPLMVAVAKASHQALESLVNLSGINKLSEPTCFEAAVIASSTGNARALRLLAPRVDSDRIEGLLTLACQSKHPECIEILLPYVSPPPLAALQACITSDDVALGSFGQYAKAFSKRSRYLNRKVSPGISGEVELVGEWLWKGLQCQDLLLQAGASAGPRDLVLAAQAARAARNLRVYGPEWEEEHYRRIAQAAADAGGASTDEIESIASMCAREGWDKPMGALLRHLGSQLDEEALGSFVCLCAQLGNSATLNHALRAYFSRIRENSEKSLESSKKFPKSREDSKKFADSRSVVTPLLQEALNTAAYEGKVDSVLELINFAESQKPVISLNATQAYLIAEARAQVKLLLAFGRVIERRRGGGEGAAIIPSKSPYHLISMRWQEVPYTMSNAHPMSKLISGWVESCQALEGINEIDSAENPWSVLPYSLIPGWEEVGNSKFEVEDPQVFVKDNGGVQVVDTLEGLKSCVEQLRRDLDTNSNIWRASQDNGDEIVAPNAVGLDMEFATLDSIRSISIVSLIQVATFQSAFVIDAIKLRPHISQFLGDLLEDPGVVKIVHGGNADIRMLWTDFDIRVANLFDTYQASVSLAKHTATGGHGLGRVVGRYYGTPLDKRLQRADWRIRPLPDRMVDYAADDARYLPGLLVMMAKELHTFGGLSIVSRRSNEMTLLPNYKPGPKLKVWTLD